MKIQINAMDSKSFIELMEKEFCGEFELTKEFIFNEERPYPNEHA
jgi:hypothetical protein